MGGMCEIADRRRAVRVGGVFGGVPSDPDRPIILTLCGPHRQRSAPFAGRTVNGEPRVPNPGADDRTVTSEP